MLTKERRRAACIHEAGHAVIFALGGVDIYRVAVAPEGSTSWVTESRKGGIMTDLWGVCSPSDLPIVLEFLVWDNEGGSYRANRKGFDALLRYQESQMTGSKSEIRCSTAEMRRQIRAHICGTLAGLVAEQIFQGNEDIWIEEYYCGNHAQSHDISWAAGLSMLLPWRSEFDNLTNLTEQALRVPSVWAQVVRLADELERQGDMEDVDEFLPKQAKDWPPSPRSKSCVLL